MVGVDQVLSQLSTVIDPDLKKDIVSMGMIKDLEVNDAKKTDAKTQEKSEKGKAKTEKVKAVQVKVKG